MSHWLNAFVAVLLLGGTAAAQDAARFEERIRRLEERLVPPVLVRGESPAAPTLAARMAELKVPGVSIAVMHRGRIEGPVASGWRA